MLLSVFLAIINHGLFVLCLHNLLAVRNYLLVKFAKVNP